MERWLPNSGAGNLVVRIRQFLMGQGWAINHHWVKAQANKCFRTKLNINKHLTSSLMSEQPGCHHCCTHDLIWVYHLFTQDADDDQWLATLHGFLPLKGLCDLCEPGQRTWGLVVRCGLEQHKLLGQSGWYFCLCSSPCGSGSRLAFSVGHRYGLPWVGSAAVGVTLQGSGGVAFINCGEVISIHLDSTAVTMASPSANVMSGSIVHQNSSPLPARWQGWPGTLGCTSSAQCCRVLAWAMVWCSWQRWMSWEPNLVSFGGIKQYFPIRECTGSCT